MYWLSLVGLVITVVSVPLIIRASKKLAFSQPIREDGPQTHLKKRGTPTMGGLAFWFSVLAVAAVQWNDPDFMLLTLVFVLFGLVGLLDDVRKVTSRSSRGVPARVKLLGQAVGAAVFLVAYFGSGQRYIPLVLRTSHIGHVPSLLYLVVSGVVMVGSANAINFADGADGLLSMTAIPTLLFVASFTANSTVRLMSILLIAILIGFLFYNRHPAKIIMGDTGSMALGGVICAMFFMSDLELLLPVVCLPYYIEILSVTIQVISFKLTGRRVFRMSPIHHHFELSGWSENKLVWMFFTASAVCALAGAGILTVVEVF
ncbi:MAG: phospho-N-acetylmuramoyl-pentapeptide-transferase [Firmicutes bacterium]|nr:phospho-N-acetylmuramoyl-pentapeptide-transferase [Bacillota bacterium]